MLCKLFYYYNVMELLYYDNTILPASQFSPSQLWTSSPVSQPSSPPGTNSATACAATAASPPPAAGLPETWPPSAPAIWPSSGLSVWTACRDKDSITSCCANSQGQACVKIKICSLKNCQARVLTTFIYSWESHNIKRLHKLKLTENITSRSHMLKAW